jgi:hypothetical protein
VFTSLFCPLPCNKDSAASASSDVQDEGDGIGGDDDNDGVSESGDEETEDNHDTEEEPPLEESSSETDSSEDGTTGNRLVIKFKPISAHDVYCSKVIVIS